MKTRGLFVALAVVIFSAAQCRWLLSAWLHSPFDRYAWGVFLLWMAPVAYAALRAAPRRQWRPEESLLVAAAACSLLGAALDFNVFRNAGLACSLVAFVPWVFPFRLLWLAVALLWMPAFGWLGSSLGVAAVMAIRFGLAAAALLCALALGARASRRAA